MISKKEFCEIINELKEFDKMKDEINNIFRKSNNSIVNSFCNSDSILIGNNDIIIKILNNMFNLSNKNNNGTLLEWWIYEEEYGKKNKKEDFKDNGIFIDLSTPEKFYDYIIKNYKNEFEFKKKINNNYISKKVIKDKIKEIKKEIKNLDTYQNYNEQDIAKGQINILKFFLGGKNDLFR